MIPPYLYDAGALIALDRADRVAATRHDLAMKQGRVVVVPAAVVTQVWRDPRRQHFLGRVLRSCAVAEVDGDLARTGGVLCARSRTHDAVDALVVATALAVGPCIIWTSDPDDLGALRACSPDPAKMIIRTV